MLASDKTEFLISGDFGTVSLNELLNEYKNKYGLDFLSYKDLSGLQTFIQNLSKSEMKNLEYAWMKYCKEEQLISYIEFLKQYNLIKNKA